MQPRLPLNSQAAGGIVKGMETDRLALAAKTDEQALNNLIETQKSWILKVCSDVTHRYITDSDDEWSTALLAFHEAVQSYDESKGTFLAFASVVIRRRLLDDIRSQWRHKGEIHVLPGELEEEPDRSITIQRIRLRTDTVRSQRKHTSAGKPFSRTRRSPGCGSSRRKAGDGPHRPCQAGVLRLSGSATGRP